MVAESFTPGASMSKVAQRYGVNANLLFTWPRDEEAPRAAGQRRWSSCRDGRRRRGPAAPVAAPGPVGRMEIVLVGGERIIIGADVAGARGQALSRR
jgi:transposase